jgi:hypothetical protein
MLLDREVFEEECWEVSVEVRKNAKSSEQRIQRDPWEDLLRSKNGFGWFLEYDFG